MDDQSIGANATHARRPARRAALLSALCAGIVMAVGVQVAFAEATTICVPEAASKQVLSSNAKGECPTKTISKQQVKYSSLQLPSAAQLAALNKILPHVTYIESGVGGKPTVQFSSVNLQVVSGTGNTFAAVNGEGNLVIGYDENPATFRGKPALQTGSNNLILGVGQEFTSYGGIVAGEDNTVTAEFASVSGGMENAAVGQFTSVTGGVHNSAGSYGDSVGGGHGNTAGGGAYSSVSGGVYNSASGEGAAVSGGGGNLASAGFSSVSGGGSNTAKGNYSSVGGGGSNDAIGEGAAVSGGEANGAIGSRSSISGGKWNEAKGDHSSISGGIFNTAAGELSSVSGGNKNEAGQQAWVGGGAGNVAEPSASAIFGGFELRSKSQDEACGGFPTKINC